MDTGKQLTAFGRIWITVGLLLGLVAIGIVGFMMIEGWNAIDAVYMTIVTLSTVGFQEVHQMSGTGRMFTLVLIVFGIGIVGYGFGNIAALFVEGELFDLFRVRKMEKMIDKIRNHIIICGCGNEGRHAMEEVRRSNVPFVVVERDADQATLLREEGVLVVQGDATDDNVLRKAGVEHAKGLIAAVNEDADNVFVTLTARGLNSGMTIVARAGAEATVPKLHKAGANRVISSAEIGGRRMASVVVRPRIAQFLDVITNDPEMELRLEEVVIDDQSSLAGQSIRDLHIRARTGTLVIAYHRHGEAPLVNPPAETILNTGDVLIVLGRDQQVQQLRKIAGTSDQV